MSDASADGPVRARPLPGFAFCLLGGVHLLALTVPLLAVLIRIQVGGEPRSADALLAFVVLLWLTLWITGGSVAVASRLGAERSRGIAAAAGFFAALFGVGVVVTVLVGSGIVQPVAQPPVFGIALGVQLAIMLSPRTAAANLWRIGVPVVADLLWALLPGPAVVDVLVWRLLTAPLWFGLALWVVLRFERRLGDG